MFGNLGLLSILGRHFRTTFVAGLLVMIPLLVTVLIVWSVANWFGSLLEPAFERALGQTNYGNWLGLGALLVFMYIVGLLASHVIGRRFIDLGHRLVNVVPVVRAIYGTLLQATEVLSGTNSTRQQYSGVVLVDFPKQGSKAVGLITSRISDVDGRPALAVFVPTTPVPTSGFLLLVNEEDATLVDITVDEAMKLIVSGGILTPDNIMHPRQIQTSERGTSNH